MSINTKPILVSQVLTKFSSLYFNFLVNKEAKNYFAISVIFILKSRNFEQLHCYRKKYCPLTLIFKKSSPTFSRFFLTNFDFHLINTLSSSLTYLIEPMIFSQTYWNIFDLTRFSKKYLVRLKVPCSDRKRMLECSFMIWSLKIFRIYCIGFVKTAKSELNFPSR